MRFTVTTWRDNSQVEIDFDKGPIKIGWKAVSRNFLLKTCMFLPTEGILIEYREKFIVEPAQLEPFDSAIRFGFSSHLGCIFRITLLRFGHFVHRVKRHFASFGTRPSGNDNDTNSLKKMTSASRWRRSGGRRGGGDRVIICSDLGCVSHLKLVVHRKERNGPVSLNQNSTSFHLERTAYFDTAR
jgi:hypothetical protein